MARTFIRHEQIASTADSLGGFNDNVAPTIANYQTNPSDLVDDLNNIRSMLSYLKDAQAGNWYDTLAVPSTLETGTARAVDDLNDALHAVEKKRILRDVHNLTDVTVPASQNYVVLGSGELPSNTTAAVGSVTTLGTVVAFHSGTFGTHALDEVSGSSAVSPKNLVLVVDGATRDPILSSGRQVYGLLQSEINSDGHTINLTTQEVQISFVRITAGGNDLEACPVADIENAVINYCSRERVRLEDLNEQDFLKGAVVDTPAGGSIDRQTAYDNQGTTAVNVTTNSTLDLEGAGLSWEIRDDLEARLFAVIEGSGGGTSEVELGTDVDIFDVNAATNDFAAGATLNSGGTRPIRIGVTDGIIDTTAGALELQATTTLSFDDGNKPGGWSLAPGINLSDAAGEWTSFESNFGEVSLLNAINQAYSSQVRNKVQAVLTSKRQLDG